jgi:hypothetical protein
MDLPSRAIAPGIKMQRIQFNYFGARLAVGVKKTPIKSVRIELVEMNQHVGKGFVKLSPNGLN